MFRTLACIGLLSATVIAFQIALVQVFSVTQWYHFAYMVISVALLGFGASGSLLAIARTWLLRHYEHVLPVSALACGISMTASVFLTQIPGVRFDSYLLFVDAGQIGALLVTYLILAIPFFMAGLVIGLVFIQHISRIGQLYAANLFGSAAGGGIGLALLFIAPPQVLPALMGLIALGAAAFVFPKRTRGRYWLTSSTAVLFALIFVVRPPALHVSEYKALSKTLQLPGAEIVTEEPSPEGLVQVVSGPSLRNAPGLSLAYEGDVSSQDFMFVNADWYGVLPSDSASLLRYSTDDLPYAMQQRGRVLVLGPGTGEAVVHARANNAGGITAVESNRTISNILFAQEALHREGTSLVYAEPRSYLATDTSHYDLIVLPTIGSFGGSAGLFALQEQYGLTIEAFMSVWARLTPDGTISISTWMDYPYRRPLRLAATLVAGLRREGVLRPDQHVAAVRSWGTITFVVNKSPIDEMQIARVREMCSDLSFDPVVLPGLRIDERAQYNALQDESLFAYIDRIMAVEDDLSLADYTFRISPTTDDRPYFSQFIRWKRLGSLRGYLDAGRIPFLELGTLIVAVTLVQTLLAAVILILLPLVRIGWTGRGRWWTMLHFGGLGLGFMFVEMVLIQRFTLYFGYPILAIVVVLTVLLFFSGVGSNLSSRVSATFSSVAVAAGVVALLILALAFALTPLLQASISLGLVGKVVVATTTIGVLACAMGFPFPLGLRLLSRRDEAQVPWAWGINGCLSVVSTVLATLFAIEKGFVAVMMAAFTIYAVVMLVAVVAGRTAVRLGLAR